MNNTSQSVDRCCQVSGKGASEVDLVEASAVRPVVVDMIRQSHSEWSADGFICVEDLNRFRNNYVRSLIEAERGELSDLEKEVLDSLARHEILTTHVEKEYEL